MILKAAWVLPIGAPPIADGYVEIEGDCIRAVGAQRELPPAAAQSAEDLGQAVLMPGLVNPHTHLELTAYAGQLPPEPFWSWIGRLIVLRRQPGRVERERQGVRDGAWQSLRAGVTCLADISRENVSWDVLKGIPLRKVCFVELLSLADLPPRNTDELRAAAEAVEEDELLTVGITPHAPYTVPEHEIRAAVALAAELDRPWTTHWAETTEEVRFLGGEKKALPELLWALIEQCEIRAPGLPPMEYLARCTDGLPAGSLAHVNYVDDWDIAQLAELGHTAIYCPRAHRFFGHQPHPFARLRAAGVSVVLGTDSPAGNEDLTILGELRHVRRHVPGAPSAAELLDMATRQAAKVLRLEERIGTLTPGKQADLAAFPIAASVVDPAAELIEQAPAAMGVWVAGRRVIEAATPAVDRE
ncbi:MAG: amidohydrolase family protein [Phycisphaerae bacterium]|jgi:cytosine/adenosine deaminase-related metal-dependent hydrolase